MDGFHWHPDARVYDGKGVALPRPFLVSGVCSDRPTALALGHAFSGGPFRIGAEAAPAPTVGFETLTSGSTGAPRRIARSFASWRHSFAVNAGLFGIGSGVRVAVLGRLVQSLSLYGAIEAITLGAELHVMDGARPDRQWAALRARGVQVIWAAPAQLQLLAEAGGAVLPAVRFVLVGGAKLDTGLRAALREMCPTAQVREFYGAAEASFITLADDETPEYSVGRAYPGVEIGIGGPAGHAADGRIWVRSPYLFQGYASADAGVATWQDGWLGLGEIGTMENGQLVLRGRIDRMVTIAGQNAYPEAIELFLLGLPGILRAAVLPRADGLRGQVLEAVLMGSGNEAEILTALRAQFGALIAPRRVQWRSDWPVLASGKADLAALAKT
ncbi:AMP-binding protein [Pseudorhodobacter sp. W20_MBD10_FR17]|uniref:AMP-binding protein n=1 Tax=Pseudorhodobacter sp. W20_MBD10_FR17 TaxID=3240266 RepID=UPI003F95D10F